MDQSNKLYRKCQRPRPYDLRRKVLLKNFLKEQMTFTSQVNEIEPENKVSLNQENKMQGSSDKLDNRQNFNEDVDHVQPSNSSDANSESETCVDDPATNSSDLITEANCFNKLPLIDQNTNKLVNVVKFPFFMKLRSDNSKKGNCISKAKISRKGLKSPSKEKPYREKIKELFKETSNKRSKRLNDCKIKKEAKRSLAWRLFRPFKNSKGSQKSNSAQSKSSSSQETLDIDMACSSTASQSVQTDLTWDLNNVNQLEKSNMLLREENRLLMESLSYFMTDTEVTPRESYRDNVFKDYQTFPGFSSNLQSKSDWFNFAENSKSHHEPEATQKLNTRSTRVLRSKSVRDHSKIDVQSKNCQRTRSMYVSRSKSTRNSDVAFTKRNRSFYSHNVRMNSWQLNDSCISIPRVKSPAVLQSLPVSSSGQQIQRRSSMPERINSKKHPRTCRRTGSFHDCHSSGHIPFHKLPAEAFY